MFSGVADAASESKKSKDQIYKIRWIAAHNPTNQPIVEMTQKAADNMSRRSAGRLKVTLVPYDNSTIDRHNRAINEVLNGTAEIAQIDTGNLNRFSSKIDVLNMPFLLNTHDRVRQVIHGKIADSLKASVLAGSDSKLQVMEFTYSGGFRVMYGSKAIKSSKDIVGAKTTISGPKPVQDFYEMMGAKFVRGRFSRGDSVALHRDTKIDFEDSELNRLFVLTQDYPEHLKHIKFVSETNHLFYLTALLANRKFLDSLPKDLRIIFESEVSALAESERLFSIEQAQSSKEYLIRNGVKWVTMSEGDRSVFEAKGRELWGKYETEIGALIKEIDALKPVTPSPPVKASVNVPRKSARHVERHNEH